jgi:hypothetical protein
MGGGIKQRNFLAGAVQAFKSSTNGAAPSAHVHPALMELIKC